MFIGTGIGLFVAVTQTLGPLTVGTFILDSVYYGILGNDTLG